ncbi:MAG: TolC family protein, partial [Planctomycetales bacterium]|nr:TolC family protein [Planctomycetales bacterium]
RRRMELRQLEAQFRATAANLTLEVERAVREVTTTYQEMMANYGAMQAADAEVNYIFERWQLLPGSDRNASLLLEDLLDAQQRLNAAEFGYLQAQYNFNVSHIAYLKALGTLLQSEGVSLERYCACNLPGLNLNRAESANLPAFQQREVTLPIDSAPASIDEDRSVLRRVPTKR